MARLLGVIQELRVGSHLTQSCSPVITEDDGNDLTHTFFNPDREGWLLKLGEPGRAGLALCPCPQQQLPGLLALPLLWSHSPQLQGRKI